MDKRPSYRQRNVVEERNTNKELCVVAKGKLFLIAHKRWREVNLKMLVGEMIRNMNFLKLQRGLSKLIMISVNSV